MLGQQLKLQQTWCKQWLLLACNYSIKFMQRKIIYKDEPYMVAIIFFIF